MDIQSVIAILLLILSIGFLIWKFAGNVLRKKGSGNDCGPDCKCD